MFDDKKDEIDENLRHIVQEEDKGIQKIIAKLEELKRIWGDYRDLR